MADWFCWEKTCQWSGYDNEVVYEDTMESDDDGFFSRVISYVPVCPECGRRLHSEAQTERAAIREYEGEMTREEAENIICPRCSGSGEGMADGTTCRTCKGSGSRGGWR